MSRSVAAHELKRADELIRHRGWRASEEQASGRRYGNFDSSLVRCRCGSRDESAFDETANDDGHRALVCRGSFGQLVERIALAVRRAAAVRIAELG